MKQYKLLKDTPMFKKGEIFDLDEDGSALWHKDHKGIVYKVADIRKAGSWFEEIPQKYKRWRAGIDGLYFFIYDNKEVISSCEKYDIKDGCRYNTGNYFKTEKEAESKLKYDLALQVIKDDTKGFVPDWNNKEQSKHHGYYDYISEKIEYDFDIRYEKQGMVYFATKEDIKDSQKNHRKEWLTVLGVE